MVWLFLPVPLPQVLTLLTQYETSNSSNYCIKNLYWGYNWHIKIAHVLFTSRWVWTHAYTQMALPHHGCIRVPSADSWSPMLILQEVRAVSGLAQDVWAKYWWVSLISISSTNSNTSLKLRIKRHFNQVMANRAGSILFFYPKMLNDLMLQTIF